METDRRKANTLTLLREATSKLGRHYEIEHQINRAFEIAGCSCHPLRNQHEQLVDECRRLEQELHSSETFKRRDAVAQEIREIDAREHPGLDRQASLAGPFFRVWLFERLTSDTPVELISPEKLAANYAEAWLGGWRPKGG
jgi:hypothetical protein